MDRVDVAVVGAGAAGLSLAAALTADRADGGRAPRVALIGPADAGTAAGRRTWCFWEPAAGAFDRAVGRSWRRLRVVGATGRQVTADLGPLRYKMLRSDRFEELLDVWFRRRGQPLRVAARVTDIEDAPTGAVVRGRALSGSPVALAARWVFDSRPPAAVPPARTTLLQHFRGWFVRTPRDAFDAGAVTLMDFRTPQPARGLSFGYVLPVGPREALVEYTEFSAAPLPVAQYEAALGSYLRRVLAVGEAEVTAVEQGVIPMTDAVFPRRTGHSVFRIGTSGGATRPATGYTFTTIQRQAAAIAGALNAADRGGAVPLPPPPHRRRHLLMDATLLRALATGRVHGASYFEQLFRNNPLPRLLRFLDGTSTLREEAAVGLSTRCAVLPMVRTLAELPLLARRPARLGG